MNARIIRSVLACSIALFAGTYAYAESVRLYQAGEIPDPRIVARILGAKPAAFANLPKTRGLFYTVDYKPDETAPVEVEIRDAGHTITEDDIAASASAAVSAWQEKLWRAAPRGERAGMMRKVTFTQPVPSDSLAIGEVPRGVVKHAGAGESAKPSVRAATNPAPQLSGSPPAAKKPDALALAINFASNSSQLTAEGRRAIDSIAEGIKLTGFERKVIVEGHTNAVGSKAHNLKLSRLRAEAVKNYLIVNHAIPEAALQTKGLGSANPLPGTHPNSAYNRRVQFRALVA